MSSLSRSSFASSEPSCLFEDFERTETRSAKQGEHQWGYLNSSARPCVVAARRMLEAWFATYPEPKLDLYQRFRSTDEQQHRSAYFELYIHEVLRRAGYSVECHPDTSKSTHPDYLVLRGGEPKFYLEVMLPRSRDELDYGPIARWNDLYNAIDSIDLPNGFLWLSHREYPKEPPKLKSICNQIKAWVNNLERNQIESEIANPSRLPEISLDGGGIELRVKYWQQQSGSPLRTRKQAIGMVFPNGGFSNVDETGSVNAALSKKAKRYGPLDLPYVIAVGVLDMFVGIDGAFMSLLGRSYVSEEDGVTFRMENRTSDGVWHDGTRPRKKNVSAVLLAYDPSPWSIAEKPPTLIHNPWAERPLVLDDWPLEEYVPDEETGLYRRKMGQEIGSYFGLTHPWPVPDPPRSL